MLNALERLVIKLVGDGNQYEQTLKSAEVSTKKTTSTINQMTDGAKVRFNSAGRQIDEMGRFVKSTTGDLNGMGTSLAFVGDGLSNMGGMISGVGRKMMWLTGLIAVFTAGAVKASGDFEQAMTKSTSIMSDVSADLRDEMEKTATTISNDGLASATDLAEGYYFLASAGMSAKASIMALPAVAEFATAGTFDLALATDLLTDAQSALGKSFKDPIRNQKEMIKLSDQMARSSQLANTSIKQVAEALTNDAAGASRAFGMESETTLAILAKYADAGKKGAEAGSMLGRAVRLLAGAYQDNGEVFERYGIKVVDEATGEYRNMIDIIGDMENAFKDLTGPQRAAALEQLGFAALAQKSIVPLIGATEQMRVYEEELKKAAGATQEVADKVEKSLWSQLVILKNIVTNTARVFGDQFKPALMKIVLTLQSLVLRLQQLSPTMMKTITIIGALVAAIGPVLLIFGGLVTATGAVVSSLGALTAATGLSIGAIMGVVGSLALWASGIGAVLTALAGITYWLVGSEGISNAWMKVTATAQVAWNAIIGFLSNFTVNMKALLNWLPNNWLNVVSDMGQLWVLYNVNMIKNIQVALRTMMRLFVAFQGFLSGVFEKVFSFDMLKFVWKGIKGAAAAFLNFAKGAWKAIKSIFAGKSDSIKMSDFIGQLENDFSGGKNDFLGTAKGILQDGLNDLKSPFDGFESSITEAPAFVYNKGVEVGTSLAEGIKTAQPIVEETTQTLVNGVSEAATKLAADVKKLEGTFKEQLDTMGMTSRAVSIYKLEMQGATDAQLAEARSLDKALTAKEKFNKLLQEGKSLTEQMKSPQEKMTDQLNKYKELLDANVITHDTYTTAVEKLQEKASKGVKIKFKATGIESVEANSADALARINEFRALKPITVPGIAKNSLAAKGIKFDQNAKAEAVTAVGKVTVGANSDKERLLEVLRKIEENTRNEDNQNQIILAGADL